MQKRTKSEVLASRQRAGTGCCDRYCDHSACDCLENAIDDDTLQVDDEVSKISGYQFPGFIRAVFQNGAGELRYVVEHTDSPDLLHIFNGTQLRLVRRDACPMCHCFRFIPGKDSNDIEPCYKCLMAGGI